MNSNDKNLNEDVLKKLKINIKKKKKNNVKTKRKSDTDMVETIRKLIMLEVDKNDNQTN